VGRPDGAAVTQPGPRTRASLLRDFGSVNEALREIRDVGLGIQGSGWVVLAYSPELRQLVLMPVGNHQNEVLVGARNEEAVEALGLHGLADQRNVPRAE
jgi:superoxide dismutase